MGGWEAVSNPKYECCCRPRTTLELQNMDIFINFLFHEFCGPESKYNELLYNVRLPKESIQEMVEQLQSWLDTGEFTKQKKLFCVVYSEDRSFVRKAMDAQEIRNNWKSGCEIYELKPEDAIK
jgi:hypothetical protein